jgi:hypothetical protein
MMTIEEKNIISEKVDFIFMKLNNNSIKETPENRVFFEVLLEAIFRSQKDDEMLSLFKEQ